MSWTGCRSSSNEEITEWPPQVAVPVAVQVIRREEEAQEGHHNNKIAATREIRTSLRTLNCDAKVGSLILIKTPPSPASLPPLVYVPSLSLPIH